MAESPDSTKLGSTKLYRTLLGAVILAALAVVLAQTVPAQSPNPKKGKPAKGPRALGVVQLLPNGKARLIPVTILLDGEYYDASAYKAAPVPMALESGTVYEGFRTGVSQGLFTVTSALQGNNTWLGNGTWRTAGEIAAAKDAAVKKQEAMSKPGEEPPEGPPVLRRASAKTPAPPEVTPTPAPAGAGSSPGPAPPSSGPAASTPPASAPAPPPAATPAASPPPSGPEPPADPDRPVLKRGAPTPAELKKRQSASAAAAAVVPAATPPASATKDAHKAVAPTPAATGPAQLIPAISDAAGPEPRPYAYNLKPDEEQKLRTKILALAADEVRAWAAAPGESAGSQKARPGSKAKPPQPSFEDVQLHSFDLSNSNEPVLVMTAKARMPARPNVPDLQYIITLVARDDIYGDLHKVFASVTDTRHFDVLSRLELIDAVDADGDGRGELLFRQVSDAGSSFVLYRVIGDRLWPLFQGTPGQ